MDSSLVPGSWLASLTPTACPFQSSEDLKQKRSPECPHPTKTLGPIIIADVQTSSSLILLLYNIPPQGCITDHSLYCCITVHCKDISRIIYLFSS